MPQRYYYHWYSYGHHLLYIGMAGGGSNCAGQYVTAWAGCQSGWRQIKPGSSGDLIDLRRNLAAIQVAADALGQSPGAAGIPIIVSRREDTVQRHKGPGQVVPVKKRLIDIRPDPSSKWAQSCAERLAALAPSTPLAVDDYPEDEADFGDDDEDRTVSPPLIEAAAKPDEKLCDRRPVPIAEPDAPAEEPVEETEGGTVLTTAPAGEPEQTVVPLKPRSPNDCSAYWVTVVPKLADANEVVPTSRGQGDIQGGRGRSGQRRHLGLRPAAPADRNGQAWIITNPVRGIGEMNRTGG